MISQKEMEEAQALLGKLGKLKTALSELTKKQEPEPVEMKKGVIFEPPAKEPRTVAGILRYPSASQQNAYPAGCYSNFEELCEIPKPLIICCMQREISEVEAKLIALGVSHEQ